MFVRKEFIIILCCCYLLPVDSGVVYRRKKIIQSGDLMIGALIPVHEQPNFNENEKLDGGSKRKCGVIRDQYGVQRVEALLYLLDKLNNKNITKILPGIQLGLEIRDECWETSIALEETIDFIKDTISSNDNEAEILLNSEKVSMNNSSLVSFNNLFDNDKNILMEKCQLLNKNKPNQNKILAVIGPAGSSVSINVQNLLQLFDIPQIGYSATSRDLSDKKMFKTFLRVVPSDYLQVKAMIDVVQTMNWTYLFAIYTDGSYGQAGMEAFRNETSYLNICLALYEKIREYASEEDYEIVIRKMNNTASARVIVCFCYGETIRGLLSAIKKLNLKGRFLILGSDGWSDRIDVAKDYYEEAVGSFSIKAYSPKVTEFDDYFINLNPSNNARNIWFNEYWEEMFKCHVEESAKEKYQTPCKSFIEIGGSCYWFSTQDLTWNDAKNECKERYFRSKIIDLNNELNLELVLNYMKKRKMYRHLKEIHARITIASSETSSSFTTTKVSSSFMQQQHIDDSSSYEKDNHLKNEQTIKMIYCNSILKNKSRIKKNKFYDYNEKINDDYEASLTHDNVVTLFDSKINEKLQCISIMIINESMHNNFDNLNEEKPLIYCFKWKNCAKKLPFICKFDSSSAKSNAKSHEDSIKLINYDDFYPDTLRSYQQDPKMSFVINSLLAVAHGLDRVHKKYCDGISGLCEKMKKLNGSELLKNVKESSFLDINLKQLYFDHNGDPPGRYVILNVQKEISSDDNTIKYIYKEVGNWNNDFRLDLDMALIKFPDNSPVLKSICSAQCDFGHVKQIKQGGLKCCWNCKKCEDNSYVLDEFACQECDVGYWPNRNLTGCERLPLTYLKWNDPASIFALFICILGILVNTFIAYIFIIYSNTCIVKSTTKELSYIILTGIYLCYFMTIPLILKPTLITCYMYRILPGFSLSLMYGSLLTKTNRIARVLSRSKKRILTKKPRFMSLTSQIIITCTIIGIECSLIIASFELDPGDIGINYPRKSIARLECLNSFLSILMPIGYNMFLVVLCTLYAVKTRNLPENFNEAKFIGFSMYTTCVIWIAFIPLYFGSDFKIITICLSTSSSATVILVFLFIPKVYIILFKPEKNQRSAFATAKDIRCHFGSMPMSDNIEESSSVKKTQNGFFDRLVRSSDLNRAEKFNRPTKLDFARYAYRPRLVAKTKETRTSESRESYASIYQIYDRSCQTSMELIDPFVERVLKKRKLLNETSSLVDEKDINNNNQVDIDKTKSLNNVTIGALGNFFILPLMASAQNNISNNSSITAESSKHFNTLTKTSSILKSVKNNNNNSNIPCLSEIKDTSEKNDAEIVNETTALKKTSTKKNIINLNQSGSDFLNKKIPKNNNRASYSEKQQTNVRTLILSANSSFKHSKLNKFLVKNRKAQLKSNISEKEEDYLCLNKESKIETNENIIKIVGDLIKKDERKDERLELESLKETFIRKNEEEEKNELIQEEDEKLENFKKVLTQNTNLRINLQNFKSSSYL